MKSASAGATGKAAGFAIDMGLVCREPYRVLFPLGIVSALIGIGIWIPYAVWPLSMPYPGQGHAVIQIQAFLMCFVFGFLATMLPKVLGVRPLGPFAFSLFPALLIGVAAASLAGAPAVAQALHLALLGNFLAFAAARLPERKSNPPPPFIFIAAAMAVDLIGTVLKLGAHTGWLEATALRAGGLLQYQAFPLLLILGVGGFLLPKLFANAPIDPKALAAGAPRLRGQAALCLAMLATFGMEIAGLYAGWGHPGIRIAYGLRAAVWAWFVLRDIRIQRMPGKTPPYLQGARISLALMLIGLIMPAFQPHRLIAWEHVVFLAGFTMLTLSIASRVMSAHAGRLDILSLHGSSVRIYGALIALAMATRVATEYFPGGRAAQLAISAAFALAALWLWGRLFLPLALKAPGR